MMWRWKLQRKWMSTIFPKKGNRIRSFGANFHSEYQHPECYVYAEWTVNRHPFKCKLWMVRNLTKSTLTPCCRNYIKCWRRAGSRVGKEQGWKAYFCVRLLLIQSGVGVLFIVIRRGADEKWGKIRGGKPMLRCCKIYLFNLIDF